MKRVEWDRHWSETAFGLVLNFLTVRDSYLVGLVQGLVTNRMFKIHAALVVKSLT